METDVEKLRKAIELIESKIVLCHQLCEKTPKMGERWARGEIQYLLEIADEHIQNLKELLFDSIPEE